MGEFPSIVNAVDCAIAVQRVLAERPSEEPIKLRIGVNLGVFITARIRRLQSPSPRFSYSSFARADQPKRRLAAQPPLMSDR